MAIEVPNSIGGQLPSNGHTNGNHHHPTDEQKNTITYRPPRRIRINKQVLPIIGLFVFYIAHDALQEEMFRFQGFEFGFFMTLGKQKFL